MNNSNSHNKVLVIGAICVSILAGVASYKIADTKNQKELAIASKRAGIFNVTGEVNETQDKVSSAIDDSLRIANDTAAKDDPFTITDKDSATSRFAKQVYSDYVNQEAGNSDLTIEDTAQNAISQLSPSDMPLSKYGMNDIHILNVSTKDNERLYGNNFGEIYLRNMTKIAQNQAKYSTDLLAIADVYENVSKELLKINVPVEVASSHLVIVNNYQIMADSFRLINSQSQNPVKSLLGVKAAKSAGDDNDQMFINISNYFNNNGIIFDKSEVGSIWSAN